MSEIPTPQLSAMEQYLFVDNRSSHPLDFFYRLRFDGVLDQARLSESFDAALRQHPLLRSVVSQSGRSYQWTPCESRPAFVVLPSDTDTGPRHPSAIDLTREPGSRLFVIPGMDRTTLLFQFQHSATDGLGAMGFIQDVLLAYVVSRSADPTLPMRDFERLAERHWCGYTTGSLFDKITKQLHGIYLSRKFLQCRIAPLIAHQPQVNTPRTEADGYRDLQHTLTVEETATLKKLAREHKASVNSWLIRDAFVTFDRVRKASDGYCADDYLRIAVPGNLRSTQSNDGIPAANFFSMMFPARNSEQIADPDTLLESIHQEVRQARTDYYFATFIFALKVIRMIPGGLKRMLHADKCQATMLFTNVGPTFSGFPSANAVGQLLLDDAVLTHVELVPPMRPFQSIAVALLEYANRQTITLSYDPRLHSDAEANGILEAYIDQLKSNLG